MLWKMSQKCIEAILNRIYVYHIYVLFILSGTFLQLSLPEGMIPAEKIRYTP